MDYALLGKNIRIYREAKGMTQERLAELAELSVKHVSKIELGKINFKVETLIKIANALDVAADALLVDLLTHPEDIYTVLINRHLKKMSSEERARFLWFIEKSKEFEIRKDELLALDKEPL